VKQSKSNKPSRALVPAGRRIDHPENLKARRERELSAAFNRMSSANDAEALNAFERARVIMQDVGASFFQIWQAAHESEELHRVNKKLGAQLKAALQENAKFRSMNFSYKFKANAIRLSLVAARTTLTCAPLLAIGIMFYFGMLAASGAMLLALPIGFYNASRGVLTDSAHRMWFGILVLLMAVIGITVTTDRDAPVMRRQEIALLENMNRDHELGPKTLTIDYPISRLTRIATVIGIRDSLQVSIDGSATPVEISCAKYYDTGIAVARYLAATTPAPPPPDIFHSVPVATFGACDVYARLVALHNQDDTAH